MPESQNAMRNKLILYLAFATMTTVTMAATCPGVDQSLTVARKLRYAGLIAQSIKAPHTPDQIEVSRSMRSGAWTAVWGRPQGMEQGVFFFLEASDGKPQFKEVWGGYALPEERPQLIKWASALGKSFPPELATCFATTVIDK
jgi:hypothetical protein